MKIVLATLLLLAALAPARADMICTTIGSITYCNDTGSTYTATCSRIGNQTWCN